MRADYEELRSVLHSFVCRARIDSHALVASIAGVLTPELAQNGVLEARMGDHGTIAEESSAATEQGLTEGAAAQRIQVAFKRSRLERKRNSGNNAMVSADGAQGQGEEKIAPENVSVGRA